MLYNFVHIVVGMSFVLATVELLVYSKLAYLSTISVEPF
jgi:hypothetical protein